jgi:hypothetical protein
MLKKSLVLSFAAFLAALFIFTGCEGPTGPAGTGGAPGSTELGSIDVTIKQPDTGNPVLLEGITYPDGAKIMSGNARDIALAFNGGVFVGDTSDADGTPVSGNLGSGGSLGEVTVYAQEGVDAIFWTGTNGAAAVQGSLVVPAGKTLFIAAPLVIGTANGTFQSITVSDKGVIDAGGANLSVNGGTNLGASGSAGKLVILAGGVIGDNAAGEFIIGGELEIHRGGSLSFGYNNIVTTAGSAVAVFGSIEQTSSHTLTVGGSMNIYAGATVDTGSGLAAFAGPLTLNPHPEVNKEPLVLDGAADFYSEFTLPEGITLALGGATNFYKDAAIEGTLNVSGGSVGYTGEGVVTFKSGSTFTNDWANIRSGTASTLRNAYAATAGTDENTNVIIADGAILELSTAVVVLDYADLLWFASRETFHIAVSYAPDFTTTQAPLVVTAGNDVEITGTTIGNIDVRKDGALYINAIVTSAGTITVVGTGVRVSDSAVFTGALGNIEVGDDNGTTSSLSLGGLIAGPASRPSVLVHKGATLTVGNGGSTYNMNFAAKIELEGSETEGVKGGIFETTEQGATAANFVNLTELKVGKKAEMDLTSLGNNVHFEHLTIIEVDGTLTVPSTAIGFDDLDEFKGNKGDVSGDSGTALFNGFTVNESTSTGVHAFDQLLAIKNLSIGDLTTSGSIETKAGFKNTQDQADADDIPDGGYLSVGTLTLAANTTLLVNRTLDLRAVTGTLATTNRINILAGKGINASGSPVLSATTDVTLVPVAAGTVTPTAPSGLGTLTYSGSLGLDPKNSEVTLAVPGKLAVATNFTAGSGVNQVTLINASLENGIVTSDAIATGNSAVEITVNGTGVLTNAGASTVFLGSKISVAKGGKITGTASTITFGTAGAAIGVGTLEAAPASGVSAIEATTINETEITGVFTLTHPAGTPTTTILSSKATKPLKITGTVNVGAQTSYDVFTLTGGTLSGVSNLGFAAAVPVVDLTTTNATLTGGTITTEGTGILKIGANFTLKAPVAQTIGSAVLNGSGALNEGELALAGSSVLSIIGSSGDFTVGNGANNATADLSVSGDASIVLANARGIVLSSTADKIGSLTLGSLTITGFTGATAISSFVSGADSISNGPYPTTDGTGLGQIYGDFKAFAAGKTVVSAAGSAAALSVNSNNAKITGGASGNTLTANTKLYTTTNSL